jgi:DNA processing protein
VRTRIISPTDDEWPGALDELGPHRSPDRLFVTGRPLRPARESIAIVGTRRPTAAGIEIAGRLSRGLVEAGFTIVSGMAIGIDSAAHNAALRAGGHTVGVLGCGLDVDYPKSNTQLRDMVADSGTLLSEYPMGTPPRASHFPERNRIIAGLCAGVVFVEGGVKSGGRITARLALDANRFVFAVPGSVRNPMAEGPNELIRTNQAALVTSVAHICDELAPGLVWSETPRSTPRDRPDLGDNERIVLEVLDDAPITPDAIGDRLRMTPGMVALCLARLEVRGFAVKRSTGYEISESGSRARNAIHRSDRRDE